MKREEGGADGGYDYGGDVGGVDLVGAHIEVFVVGMVWGVGLGADEVGLGAWDLKVFIGF